MPTAVYVVAAILEYVVGLLALTFNAGMIEFSVSNTYNGPT